MLDLYHHYITSVHIINLLAQVLFIVKLEIALKDVYKPRIKLRPGDFETTGFIQLILRLKKTMFSAF